jgi:hypothetical protein
LTTNATTTSMDMGHCNPKACPSSHSTGQRPRSQSFWQGHHGPGALHPQPPSPHPTSAKGQRTKEVNRRNTTGRDNAPPLLMSISKTYATAL